MQKTFIVFCLLMTTVLGFWIGGESTKGKKKETFHPEKNYPIMNDKLFAFIVYARNDGYWCERTLRSIFEQNYERFRVVFIDDASFDQTLDKVNSFVMNNSQEHRVIVIKNEQRLGKIASLRRAVNQLSDNEIAIPIDAKNWLAQEAFLSKLNCAYQNPDVWTTFSPVLSYPNYSMQVPVLSSFYAVVFKQSCMNEKMTEQHWQKSVNELANGRCRILTEPYLFSNQAVPTHDSSNMVP